MGFFNNIGAITPIQIKFEDLDDLYKLRKENGGDALYLLNGKRGSYLFNIAESQGRLHCNDGCVFCNGRECRLRSSNDFEVTMNACKQATIFYFKDYGVL